MELNIREARDTDVDVIFRLILALSSHQDSEEYVLTDVDKLRQHGFGPERKFETLLAEKNGTTVGYLTYIWNYSTWAGDYHMYIENLFVLEPYRRSGAGGALMQGARAVCEKNGCSHMKWEVQSDNEEAIAFYEEQGATISLRGIGSCKLV